MVIEHSFVTTLPAQEALTAASDMLGRAGFVAEAQEGFRLGESEWTTLQMKRGRKRASAAKDPTECPQRIRLDWDRGLVTVAALIEPRVIRRTFSYTGFFDLSLASSTRAGKRTKDFSDLMILIATSVEDLLARRLPAEVAEQQWYAFQDQLKIKAKKARRRQWIYVGIFLIVVAAFVAVAVVAGSHHG